MYIFEFHNLCSIYGINIISSSRWFFCLFIISTVLCKAIRNSTSLTTVNFSGCSLTWRGGDILAQVVRVRKLYYHGLHISISPLVQLKSG